MVKKQHKGYYVSIEAHNQRLDEIKRYFGGDPKTVIQNVIDKYLPQYCEEQRTYHQTSVGFAPINTNEPEKPAQDDFSSDMDELFS